MSEPPPCRCRLHKSLGDEAGWDDNDRNLVSDVRSRGWSVCIISDGQPHPAWAFSVGIWHTFRKPELAMFSLGPQDMGMWINLIGEQIRFGRTFDLDEPASGVLNGFPVRLRLADESWYRGFFGYGLWFYQDLFPLAQVIWPDRQGKFPWEPGSGELCRTQPPLWVARSSIVRATDEPASRSE